MKFRNVLTAVLIISLVLVSFAFVACGENKDTSLTLNGKYVIVDIKDDPDGTTIEELDEMYKDMDMDLTDNLYISFSDSSRFKLVLFGKTEAEGTFAQDGDVLALNASDGRVSKADISGGKVTWVYENGAILVFQRSK